MPRWGAKCGPTFRSLPAARFPPPPPNMLGARRAQAVFPTAPRYVGKSALAVSEGAMSNSPLRSANCGVKCCPPEYGELVPRKYVFPQ
jgi:hypothetical protein